MKARPSLLERLAGERGLSFLLVFLVVLLFVVYPFFSLGRTGRLLVDALLSLVLLSSAVALERPRLRALALVLAVAAIGARGLAHLLASPETTLLALVLTIAYLWTALGMLLARVLAKGRITLRRVQGAVAVYLLIGLAFALMYALVERLAPGSFALGASGDEIMAQLAYYSFVTLTTVGYGDVVPLGAGAKQMAVLEGLIGQLFPAILLARLVSLEVAHSRAGGEDAERE